MKRHLSRTLLIAFVLILAIINVYPTFGWMSLSDTEREARLARWHEEDAVFEQPNAWRDFQKGAKRWLEYDRDWVINLGLDLQGGVHTIVGIDMDRLPPETLKNLTDVGFSEQQALEQFQQQILQNIERRVNEFESREPMISTLGSTQVQIQLPGERDVQRVQNLIMRTAYLGFHITAGREETMRAIQAVGGRFPDRFLPYLLPPTPSAPEAFRVPVDHVERIRTVLAEASEVPGLIPADKKFALGRAPKPWDDEQSYRLYLMNSQEEASGDVLNGAYARQDEERFDGSWMIFFTTTADGARQFGDLTDRNIGRNMAIVLDDIVVGAPTIQSRITTNGSITGNFTPEEAQDLAIALNSGSLPVPIKEEMTGLVSATLGADSIRSGVVSAVAGLICVALFMLIYYMLAGVVAMVSLACNALLVLALLAYTNSTLTLPGIAGLILTIGMAVDANVLIFERIREELRNGKALISSIESGFRKATSAILDANITTLITAAVLMEFGSGPVESFAITLSIGVVTSVFAALVVTRSIIEFLAEQKFVKSMPMLLLIPANTHIKFFEYRKYAFIGSGIAVAIGLALAITQISTGAMLGPEFTTGTSIIAHVNVDDDVNVADVRERLTEAGFVSPRVTAYQQDDLGIPNSFHIRLSEMTGVASDDTGEGADTTQSVAVRVQDIIASIVEGQPLIAGATQSVELDRVETVGPAVGAQMQRDAVWAILSAIVFIIAYLWVRFELRFSLAAIVALVHDVSITLGLFALTGREISLPVIAALLTIIGYSLNDTIVVFDRIRENMQLFRGRGMKLGEMLDISVNDTLSRTLITSITTLFVVVVLFFFGGPVINDFAFALIVGILVGTYSSIFVASPMLNVFDGLQRKYLPNTLKKEKVQEKQQFRRKKKKQLGDEPQEEATV